MTWIHRAASKFALQLVSDSPISVSRHGIWVEFEDLKKVYTPSTRARVGAHLLGARIGIDTNSAAYDFRDERPRVDISKRLSDAPSAYGRRFPRLVHSATLDVIEAVTGSALFCTPAPDPGFFVIYIREVGKYLHALSKEEHAVHYNDGELEGLARAALFHELGAYKPRLQQEKTAHGKIRIYKNTDSQMASRSLLLPDFDLDASREGGFASVPDIDILLVAEPTDQDREALKWELMARSAKLWREATIPFSKTVFQLNMKGVEVLLDSWSSTEVATVSPLRVTNTTP